MGPALSVLQETYPSYRESNNRERKKGGTKEETNSRCKFIGVFTTRGSYNQGSYNQGFLQPGVLQTCLLTNRVLQPRVLKTRRSYNQGFLQPGVLQVVSMATLVSDQSERRKYNGSIVLVAHVTY